MSFGRPQAGNNLSVGAKRKDAIDMSSPAGGPGPRTEALPVVRQDAESMANTQSVASIAANTQRFARRSRRLVRLLVAATATTTFVGVFAAVTAPHDSAWGTLCLIILFAAGALGTRKVLLAYRDNRKKLVACQLALVKIAESAPIDERPDDTWRLGR